MFVVPNGADASFPAQAQVDTVDWQILAAGAGGANGVISGCAVTAQGTPDMTVAVASGSIRVSGTPTAIAVASGNVTIPTAHASLPRFDLITVNNSGTKACASGTATTIARFPAIPANSIVLAAVYVPAADTAIQSTQIVDKRVEVPAPTVVDEDWFTVSKAADETRHNNTLAVDGDLTFAMLANTKYRVRGVIVFQTVAAADFKWRTVGPASPVQVGIRHVLDVVIAGVTSVGTLAIDTAYSAADEVEARTSAFAGTLKLDGVIHNGATAGPFGWWWAQNNTNAGDTTTLGGSYLEYAIA